MQHILTNSCFVELNWGSCCSRNLRLLYILHGHKAVIFSSNGIKRAISIAPLYRAHCTPHQQMVPQTKRQSRQNERVGLLRQKAKERLSVLSQAEQQATIVPR